MYSDVTENVLPSDGNDACGYKLFGTESYIPYILEKYSSTIIRLSYTYVKNTYDAEDIMQDVLLSLIKRSDPFETEEHERAWILRITIKKCKNHLKSSRIKNTISLDDTENEAVRKMHNSVSESFTEEESYVMDAVLALPEKYRTPIHLFYYDGYSIKEIAQILKKKPATVGTLLARGRNMLKKSMIGGFDDE